MSKAILHGVRVVDCTADIAGPYCTKLLADAGADVVKIESESGDPLRRWGSGALFEYLNASKRSVQGDPTELMSHADIVVTNSAHGIDVLRTHHPSLVVVAITSFGIEGPWSNRPGTEFTLQAACGSTGRREYPNSRPWRPGGASASGWPGLTPPWVRSPPIVRQSDRVWGSLSMWRCSTAWP